MNRIRNILDRLPLDNKLATSIVTAALTKLVLAVGLDINDPLVEDVSSLVVAGVVGYLVPNEGTDLRQGNFDNGNPEPPAKTGELGDEEVE